MAATYDRDRVVECMFDPITSLLIAELEDGKKPCSHLANTASISEDDVIDRFSYLIEHGFILKSVDESSKITTLEANSEKLTEIVEDGDNFDAAVSGLEKMDSYLN